jgi:hypothetical protein
VGGRAGAPAFQHRLHWPVERFVLCACGATRPRGRRELATRRAPAVGQFADRRGHAGSWEVARWPVALPEGGAPGPPVR